MRTTRDDRPLPNLSRWTQEDKRIIKSDLFIIFLQMTREEKIAVIYQEMANKELTFGCKVKFGKWVYKIIDRENVWFLDPYKGVDWNIHNTIVIEDGVNSRCYSIEEIIWHPVMIWDVIDWIEPYWALFAQSLTLSNERQSKIKFVLVKWHKKREPIEMQSDECIDFVYSLIQK